MLFLPLSSRKNNFKVSCCTIWRYGGHIIEFRFFFSKFSGKCFARDAYARNSFYTNFIWRNTPIKRLQTSLHGSIWPIFFSPFIPSLFWNHIVSFFISFIMYENMNFYWTIYNQFWWRCVSFAYSNSECFYIISSDSTSPRA